MKNHPGKQSRVVFQGHYGPESATLIRPKCCIYCCLYFCLFWLRFGVCCAHVRQVGRHWLCKWLLLETSAEGGQVARFSGAKKKKGPGCGELLRNDQRMRILHPSKETDMTCHQSDGNICGETNDLCCFRRVVIKTTEAWRGKSDIVFRCLGSEGWKHINIHGFLQLKLASCRCVSPFPPCLHQLYWTFALSSFLRGQKDYFTKSRTAFQSLTA